MNASFHRFGDRNSRPSRNTRSHVLRGVALMATIALMFVVCVAGTAHAQGAPFGVPHAAMSPSSSFVAWVFAKQAAFYRSLSGYIRASRDDGSAMWGLFGVSFLYGIFHAAGPGHGKAVISSYLVANEETWRRGVILSFVSAAIQSVVAIVIVAIAAVLLGTTAKAIGSTVHIVEIVSYVLVILIGLRLLFVKGRSFLISCRELNRPVDAGTNMRAAGPVLKMGRWQGSADFHCAHCDADHGPGFHCHDDHSDDHHASAWGHAHGPEPAELAGAGGWRRGFSAVMAVGLRPCSGAIIVLIFAWAQDLFWSGVGATLIMGVGTAITVAAIATLAVGARRLAGRIAKSRSGFGILIMKGVEVGASVLIVAFGVLLLAGYMASEQLWMFTG